MMEITHGDDESLLPYFPGYKYEKGVSTYQDEEVGEGGYVYAEPGMHGNVALLDIVSMHPHSVIAGVSIRPEFTKRFKEIVDGRVSIKHKAWDAVNTMLNGKLAPYIMMVQSGGIDGKRPVKRVEKPPSIPFMALHRPPLTMRFGIRETKTILWPSGALCS